MDGLPTRRIYFLTQPVDVPTFSVGYIASGDAERTPRRRVVITEAACESDVAAKVVSPRKGARDCECPSRLSGPRFSAKLLRVRYQMIGHLERLGYARVRIHLAERLDAPPRLVGRLRDGAVAACVCQAAQRFQSARSSPPSAG